MVLKIKGKAGASSFPQTPLCISALWVMGLLFFNLLSPVPHSFTLSIVPSSFLIAQDPFFSYFLSSLELLSVFLGKQGCW
jgi:hypothetical protein